MKRKRKSGKKPSPEQKVLFLTAIIEFITAALMLLKELLE